MGNVKIPYYVTRQRPGATKWGYWAPCLARRNPKTGAIEPTLMAKLGFQLVDCGEDGPAAWAIANRWNERWQRARKGEAVDLTPLEKVFPRHSVGEAFTRFRATNAWKGMKPRTQEDWLRGWKHIEPVFGDVDPRSIAFEDMDVWYAGDPNDPKVKGLLGTTTVREAYGALKTWRTLWNKVLTTMRRAGTEERYAEGKDPSLGVRRKTPRARNQIWYEDEAWRLVRRAWREGFRGLACILAIAWDTQLSPVDVRSLVAGARVVDHAGTMYFVDRAKTGRPAIGTLSRRTEILVAWYLQGLGVALHADMPLFRTRGAQPGPKGGRRWLPRAYSKDTLAADLREIRTLEFPGDKRQLRDFRRSGAVEALAGAVDPGALAAKMGNSIDKAKALQETYLPHQASVVRLADEARVRGKDVLAAGRGGKRK